jgi:hypothetical protein
MVVAWILAFIANNRQISLSIAFANSRNACAYGNDLQAIAGDLASMAQSSRILRDFHAKAGSFDFQSFIT